MPLRMGPLSVNVGVALLALERWIRYSNLLQVLKAIMFHLHMFLGEITCIYMFFSGSFFPQSSHA